jgi:PTS system beta-glucosides-specific IIC component
LCSTYGWIDSTTGVYTFLNAAGDAVFYFLPFVLAATAAK